MTISYLLTSYWLSVNKQFHFRHIWINFNGLWLIYFPSTHFPITAGNSYYWNIFPPHSLKIVSHILPYTVIISQSLIVYSRHWLLASSHIKINEIPISASTNPFCILYKRKIMFYIRLLIFDTKIKGTSLSGMQPLVTACSPFTDNHRLVRVTTMLIFTPCIKIF